jgi:hypothetical protein
MQGPVDPTEIQAGEGDEADGRPATLDRTSLLDSGADPELERWTAALRRDTGAELAAFALTGLGQTVIKSVSSRVAGSEKPRDLPADSSLERYLAGRSTSPGHNGAACAYLEAPITVEGQVLGAIGVVDRTSRDWSDPDRDALEDAAAARPASSVTIRP